MKSVRRVASAIALMVAMVGASTVPAFAALHHPICATNHHDCGSAPKVTKCCCGDEQSSPADSTPSQLRVELRLNLSSMPAVTDALHVALTPHTRSIGPSSPPHRPALDLPTRFSSLLI